MALSFGNLYIPEGGLVQNDKEHSQEYPSKPWQCVRSAGHVVIKDVNDGAEAGVHGNFASGVRSKLLQELV